jgi:hypothetical protein
MTVDVLIMQGASGTIPNIETDLAQLHLPIARNYVVLAKGQVRADADLDVTLRLHTLLDTGTTDEVRLFATHRDVLAPPAGMTGEFFIPHTFREVSAASMLTITVSVPDDDSGFFTARLVGNSNIAGREASFGSLSMIGLPADSFVTG